MCGSKEEFSEGGVVCCCARVCCGARCCRRRGRPTNFLRPGSEGEDAFRGRHVTERDPANQRASAFGHLLPTIAHGPLCVYHRTNHPFEN
jgi:hypothetical protein